MPRLSSPQDHISKSHPRSKCDLPQVKKVPWGDTFSVPAGFQWCKGESASNGGDRGTWLYKTEDIDLNSSSGDDMEMEVS